MRFLCFGLQVPHVYVPISEIFISVYNECKKILGVTGALDFGHAHQEGQCGPVENVWLRTSFMIVFPLVLLATSRRDAGACSPTGSRSTVVFPTE